MLIDVTLLRIACLSLFFYIFVTESEIYYCMRRHLIVHLFALAHGLTAIVFHYLGIDDAIPLTILTILLILSITRQYAYPLDISAALALLGCFAGFFLGTNGAIVIGKMFGTLPPHCIGAITTFVVTELIGWLVYFIVYRKVSDGVGQ